MKDFKCAWCARVLEVVPEVGKKKMARSTSIKEALKRWQEEHEGQDPVEAADIQLQFRWPPIEKMDGTLGTLVNCQ